MKIEIEIPDAKFPVGSVVRIPYHGKQFHRIVFVLSRFAGGELEITNDRCSPVFKYDHYAVVHQEGSQYADGTKVMPGTVVVIRRDYVDSHGEPWTISGPAAEPIWDSDEYRKRRDEWESRPQA